MRRAPVDDRADLWSFLMDSSPLTTSRIEQTEFPLGGLRRFAGGGHFLAPTADCLMLFDIFIVDFLFDGFEVDFLVLPAVTG
jgi:hypothetical protein